MKKLLTLAALCAAGMVSAATADTPIACPIVQGAKIKVTPDSFGVSSFPAKTVFLATYRPVFKGNTKKDKKVNVKWLGQGKVEPKASVSVLSTKSKQKDFTWNILANDVGHTHQADSIPVTVKLANGDGHPVTMYAVPPKIVDSAFFLAGNGQKDNFVVATIFYAGSKALGKMEYLNPKNGKVLQTAAVEIKASKWSTLPADVRDSARTMENDWDEYDNVRVMVFKMNSKFNDPEITTRGLRIDNKNGVDAVELKVF